MVLVGPLATPETDVASVVARQMAFRQRVDEPTFLPESYFMAKEGTVLQHFAARKDIAFIRPDLVQCRSDRCDYFRDGESLFADDSHLARARSPYSGLCSSPDLTGSSREPRGRCYRQFRRPAPTDVWRMIALGVRPAGRER